MKTAAAQQMFFVQHLAILLVTAQIKQCAYQ